MKILGFNITRNTPQPVQKSLSPSALEWLRGEDLDGLSPRLQNAYQQVAWVYRAINVLAEQVANIPFRFSVGEAGGEHLITRGPLLDFYARPHPHINRFQYWELRIIWLMLRGECFRIPIYEDAPLGSPSPRREGWGEGELSASACVSNPNPTHSLSRSPTFSSSSELSTLNSQNPQPSTRRLRRVLILDPAHFQHIIQNNELIGWRYTGFGPSAPLASQVFLPEEVWHERLPNPFDFWRGLPPLYAAASAAKTDYAAGVFMQGLIQNNGDTGLIVSSKKPLSDEQREQLEAEIRNRRCRAGAMNGPLVLSGVTQLLKPELSSSDLQFLENRKFSRAEICAAFGVPEEIITTTDGAKYDIMAGARLNFIENRVAPLCRRLEAEEEVTVKALDPNAAGWFDLDSLPIMQEARQNRLAAAQTGFSMGVPFNELNRVLDLGFKPLPWGEKGFVAGGLQPVGEQSFKPQASSLRETSNSKVKDSDPFRRALQFLSRRREEETPSTNTQAPEKLQVLNTKSAERVMLAGKLRRFFFEQRSRILSMLNPTSQTSPTGPSFPPSATLLDLAAENAKLLARLPQLTPDTAAEINEATLSALIETWQQSAAAGETIEQFCDRVRHIYNHASRERAKEIAERLQQ